jgi:CheY-like chemotaxis protein
MIADKPILLVEDHEKDEILILRTLRKNHIVNQVVVARDGVEALDYLFGTGPHAGNAKNSLPQLVLLDLKLPRVDGAEVLRRLRADERTKQVPVIVLTSSKEEEDIVRSYAGGAHAYVSKPMDFGQLMDAIRTMGLYWVVLSEAPPTTS